MPVDSTHAFASGAAFRKPSAPPALAAWIGSRLAALALRSQVARVWQAFEAGATIAPGCRLGPSAWCVNEGPRDRIRIGAGSVCRGVLRRETFGDGTLILGEAVYVGDDCIVSCAHTVEIGRGTLLGHGVQIFDNDSHPLDPDLRAADWNAIGTSGGRQQRAIAAAPVSIGERAWLGFRSTVLKGVTVGAEAVIAAGSVVTSDVEPRTVVAGNPARPVRSLP